MTTKRATIDWNRVRERLAQAQTTFADGQRADAARLNEVYRRRAQQLARRGREKTVHIKTTPVIVFGLRGERFGIELSQVKQVFPQVPITPLPGANPPVIGVANLKGSICSVIDPAVLLNLPVERCDGGYVILLRVGDRRLGLRTETLEGVRPLDLEALADVDEASSDVARRIARGRTNDAILILDAVAVVECAAEATRAPNA